MANLVVLSDGWYSILAAWLRQSSPPSTLRARLFAADLTPAHTDSSAPYLAGEADYSGYAPQLLTDWSAVGSSTSSASSTAVMIGFEVSDPVPVGNWIYGYFVTATGADGEVLWAERFSLAPLRMTEPGDVIFLQANLTVASLFG